MEPTNSTITDEAINSVPMPVPNVYPHYTIFVILIYMSATGICVINSGIFSSYIIQRLRRPKSVKLSPAGLMTLNLVFADALVGIFSFLMMATETKNISDTRWACSSRLGFAFLSICGSHMALIVVALDRYIAIIHALQYRDRMTMKKSIILVGCSWVIPVLGSIIPIATNTWRNGLAACEEMASYRLFVTYILVPSNIVAVIIVMVIQSQVYFKLKRHERPTESMDQVLNRCAQKTKKLFYQVTTIFVICVGLSEFTLIMVTFWQSPEVQVFYDISVVVCHLSLCLNPSIYSFKTQNIRKPVLDLFGDIKNAVICEKFVAKVAKQCTDETKTKTHVGGDSRSNGSPTPSTKDSSLDGLEQM